MPNASQTSPAHTRTRAHTQAHTYMHPSVRPSLPLFLPARDTLTPRASFSKWYTPFNVAPRLTLAQDRVPLPGNFSYDMKFIFVLNLPLASLSAPDVAAVCIPAPPAPLSFVHHIVLLQASRFVTVGCWRVDPLIPTSLPPQTSFQAPSRRDFISAPLPVPHIPRFAPAGPQHGFADWLQTEMGLSCHMRCPRLSWQRHELGRSSLDLLQGGQASTWGESPRMQGHGAGGTLPKELVTSRSL